MMAITVPVGKFNAMIAVRMIPSQILNLFILSDNNIPPSIISKLLTIPIVISIDLYMSIGMLSVK